MLIPPKSAINVPGCGDSLLSEHVALMGHSVLSFDFEPGVIEKMRQRKSTVNYQVGDMLKMDYPNQNFDVVLDKGSFDALCVDSSETTKQNVKLFCDGVKRVLKHS